MYEDLGLRDVNCSRFGCLKGTQYMLWPKVWWMCLCKFTSVPFGYVCVHRSRAYKLLHMYVCVRTLCVAWFKNFMYSSTVNNGSPSVVLVKGKLSAQGFEGYQAPGSPSMLNGSWTVDHPWEVPVLKVCYCRCCPQFFEIHPAFQLNTGTLGIRCWVGLCIKRSGPIWRS